MFDRVQWLKDTAEFYERQAAWSTEYIAHHNRMIAMERKDLREFSKYAQSDECKDEEIKKRYVRGYQSPQLVKYIKDRTKEYRERRKMLKMAEKYWKMYEKEKK